MSDTPDNSNPDKKTAAEVDHDRTVISASATTPKQVVEDPVELTPPPAAPAPSLGATEGASVPVPVGTLINNNYEIKELISAGGMGEVFRGENAFTGDAVAIKIVLQSLAHDPKIAALFMREAKVLCGLADQAIVRYYNFVRDPALDRFCLIMEFIDGVPLSDHIKTVAPLTLDQARTVLRRVAGGLGRAHQIDVVHRDLSPDNVMLRGGDVDEAVLIDFGIAKSSEMAESTLHGQLAGKFKYISPEQLGHFGGAVGPRTDVYGLGLLMAAALRGSPLDMGSSIVEAVNARREIPDLSDVDPALRPLLAHMLEPDPAHRPSSMDDVIAMLDDPTRIPEKYGAVAPIAMGQAPTAQSTLGITPAGNDNSMSPFGGVSILPGQLLSQPPSQGAGRIAQPGQTTQRSKPRPEKKKSGGALRWLIVLALLGGAGGFAAMNQDLFLPQPDVDAAGETEDGTPELVAEPATEALTRASFLASFDSGGCGIAQRIATGRLAGTIAAYSATAGAFDGLADQYEAAFDSRPTVNTYEIRSPQCPALDLVRALGASGSVPAVMSLDSNVMQKGGSIVGRLSDRRGRPVWLGLVTTTGEVYNLTEWLTEQADGSATFSFGLDTAVGDIAEPNLILAIASDAPLIAAAAASDGTRASSLLPLIEAELVGRGGTAGAAIQYFEMTP